MDKEKKQQMILIVLIPLFLIGLIYMRSQKKPGQAVEGAKGQKELFKPDVLIEAMPAPKAIFDSVYTPSKEDPFKNLLQLYLYNMRKVKPKEKTSLPLPKFTIEGIIWNANMPQAIVNGQVVRIGDTIEGVRIVKIEKQGITIDYNGESVLIERR